MFEATHAHDSPCLTASTHSNCAAVQLQDHMQSGMQEECLRIAERWCTLISLKIRSDQTEQRVLQEFLGIAYSWLTSI